MKIRKILIFLILLTVAILFTTKVYAVECKVSLQGEDTVEQGGTGSAYLTISSEEGVGAITLTIDTRNIKEITCSGENSWVIQAENTDKGIYQLVKATGGKAENILKINYKIEEEVNEAEIEVKEISASTIELEDFEMEGTSKKITVKAAGEGPKEKDPEEKDPEEKDPTEKDPEDKGDTQANKPYDYNGLKEMGFVVIAVIGITAISYIGYKKYKNI